jgi:hypothetical protein
VPGPITKVHVLVEELSQPEMIGQRRRLDQPGIGDDAWSSSKVTEIRSGLCEDERIEIVPFSRGMGWFRNPHFPLQKGTFRGC